MDGEERNESGSRDSRIDRGCGGAGTAEGSWHLVHFIRHLPELTPEELLEMERQNPKSPAEWKEMREDEQFLRGETAAPTRPPPHAH